VIDYGVAPEFFKAQWNPSPEPIILFAGSLCTPKGIEELVEVFKQASFANVTLEVAGEGVLMEKLLHQKLPNLVLLGRLSRSALIQAMERAWVLAIPTHADTGPSVVKEARVIGLPIVTTDAAGAAHYVSNSGAGHVVPVNDPTSIALALQDLLQSRDFCQQVGQQGWEEHREIFRPFSAAEKFTELYRRRISLSLKS